MSETPKRVPFVQILQEFSIPLLAGVVVALVWANVDAHSLHAFTHASIPGLGGHVNLHFLTNDILMAFFFGLAAKEITEACLPGGALSPLKSAINPAIATIGGVVGPAGTYLLWVWWTGDTAIANGWAIPTATDIAMGWLIARMIFGARHPAVQFLVLVAVLDDGIGLAIIAAFYPDPTNPVAPAMLGLVGLAIAGAWGLRKLDVQNYWLYLLGPGVLSWSGLMLAHLHPALALVPIVPFMPSATRDTGLYVEEGEHLPHSDTLNRFEHAFKLPVDFGLFAFGLANAGVAFTSVGNATTAVLLGLAVGKTLGVVGFGLAGRALGFPLPAGVHPRSLVVVAMISAIGLTVSLFMAGAAFTDPAIRGAAKMGALLSIFMAPIAMITARLLGVRKQPATGPNADEAEAERATA